MEQQNQPQYTQQFNPGNNSNNYNPPPKTWLAESIIVTLLCCQIFGIIAIIYSSKVESKHRAGDFRGARDASNTAKNWVIAAAVTGFALVIIFMFTGVLAAIANGGF